MQAQVRVKSSLGQISKHHATVQIKRERYNSRREKNPQEILKDFFTTAVVPFTLDLDRGVMLHI